jgi:hypothetical protein
MLDSTPWSERSRPGPRGAVVSLDPAQREAAESAMRPAKAQQRIVRRAQALLLFADGVSVCDVARLLGVHQRTAFEWKQRFLCADPASKLADAPRSGRPRSLSPKRTRRAS